MRSSNITANVEKGNHLAMFIKSPLRFLVVLGFAGLVAMGASFGSVSADGATHQIAGDYTVEPAVIAGPPVVENGVATVAGTVTLDPRGSQVGPTVIDFTCALGADGAPNVCQGTYLFDGTIRGKTGTYRATLKDWTAGGDEAFTSARFKLIPGSGTGGLSTVVVAEGFVQRDETVEPAVGVYWGKVRFKAEAGDLSGYSASELFHMEAVGKITIEELIAELDRQGHEKFNSCANHDGPFNLTAANVGLYFRCSPTLLHLPIPIFCCLPALPCLASKIGSQNWPMWPSGRGDEGESNSA